MCIEELAELTQVSLNRYMVECKCKERSKAEIPESSLNRYMVECKCFNT